MILKLWEMYIVLTKAYQCFVIIPKKHSKWTKENLNKNSVNGKVNLSLEYIGNHWLVQVWCVDYQRQTLAPNTAASQRSKMSERSIKNSLLFDKCDTSSTINRRNEKQVFLTKFMHFIFFSFLQCDKKTETFDKYA